MRLSTSGWIGYVLAAAHALVWAIVPACVWAQAPEPIGAYPSRAVRLIVPYAAGGVSDIVGRVLAQKMSELLGQPMVVENRTGAGGMVGTGSVSKAPPDGYTIVLS